MFKSYNSKNIDNLNKKERNDSIQITKADIIVSSDEFNKEKNIKPNYSIIKKLKQSFSEYQPQFAVLTEEDCEKNDDFIEDDDDNDEVEVYLSELDAFVEDASLENEDKTNENMFVIFHSQVDLLYKVFYFKDLNTICTLGKDGYLREFRFDYKTNKYSLIKRRVMNLKYIKSLRDSYFSSVTS